MAKSRIGELARAVSFPGIDPRTFVISGVIATGDNSVRIDEEDGCMYADVVVAGTDVEYNGNDAESVSAEITVQLVFPTNGTGMIYPGMPTSGTPVVVVISGGMVDYDVFGFCTNAGDRRLPKSVIARPNDVHIVAPQGQAIRLGSRSDGMEKSAARVDDEIQITSSTDNDFVSFINSLRTAWNVAIGAGTPLIPTDPVSPSTTSIKGKITKGSSRVKIGGNST